METPEPNAFTIEKSGLMRQQKDSGATKVSRHDQILQALATMLEQSPGGRITTAGIANEVGVSEAALYRHFPSKAKMYEGLIDFTEDTLFSRITRINKETLATNVKCHQILTLLLTFAEKNPGITRMLIGDPLAGENGKLRRRIAQVFDRLEVQLKQILRESELRDEPPLTEYSFLANLMLSTAVGKICQYVRTDFMISPTLNWDEQWRTLSSAIFSSKS